jgi:hypothetical protein
MSPRLRKLIGLVAILAFLTAYVLVAARISDFVPPAGPWRLIYFALAGVLWGVPLFPLISWMSRGR